MDAPNTLQFGLDSCFNQMAMPSGASLERMARLVIEYICLVAKLQSNILNIEGGSNNYYFCMEGLLFRMDGYAKRRFAHLVME